RGGVDVSRFRIDKEGWVFEILSTVRSYNGRRATVFGELQRPFRTVLGIDFKEPGALIAPRKAILNPEYRKGLVAGAHEYVAIPCAAANIIDSKQIIKASLQVALIQYAAVAGR